MRNLPSENIEHTNVEGIGFISTGDVVEVDECFDAKFLGRLDRQIKLNGKRMNLDRVENVFNLNSNSIAFIYNINGLMEYIDIYCLY